MDVPCSIQGNIHAFSLIINVSRILGTYQCWKALLLYLEEFDFFIGVLYIEISEVSF